MPDDDLKHDQNPLHAFASWTATVPNRWSTLALERAEAAFTDKIAGLAQRWGQGSVRTIMRSERLSAPMAALVGGTAAHALDFDDNFDPAKAHATAVLGPALLAVADDRDLSGTALLDAYIVGLQIIGRVGQGVNPFHRSRGWHATATVGAVGSAAGVARLIGLDEEQAAHAMSLATSYAGGFMSQFGTMTKPLHAGLAAAGAVQAAEAAEAGITAGANTLDSKNGMGTLMVGPDVEDLRAQMARKAEHGQTVTFAVKNIGAPLHIEEYGLKVKRFPNCGSVHRALDGLLELREAHDITPGDVDHILVRAPAAHLRNLMYDNPTNSMEAKFSLEFGLAVGLLTGNAGLKDYGENQIDRPDVRALMPLVRKEYVEKLESEFPTEVHVTFKSGKTVSTQVRMPIGSSDRPLTNAQIWDKFTACTEQHLDKSRRDAVQTAVQHLRSGAGVRSLLDLLVP